jgi:hypothetical protein
MYDKSSSSSSSSSISSLVTIESKGVCSRVFNWYLL